MHTQQSAYRAVTTEYRLDRYALYYRDYDTRFLQAFLADPDSLLIPDSRDTLYKHDRTTTVASVNRDGQRFVIKRYNTKNPWHLVRRLVRRSRADICWQLAHRFAEIGIDTAPPVAMLEKRLGPLRCRSFYVMEYVDGVLCADYVKQHTRLEALLAEIRRIFALMITHRVSHGDMKATNLLVTEGDRVVLLDLDAAREHRNQQAFVHAFHKDRERFLRNWDELPELKEHLDRELPKANPER